MKVVCRYLLFSVFLEPPPSLHIWFPPMWMSVFGKKKKFVQILCYVHVFFILQCSSFLVLSYIEPLFNALLFSLIKFATVGDSSHLVFPFFFSGSSLSNFIKSNFRCNRNIISSKMWIDLCQICNLRGWSKF